MIIGQYGFPHRTVPSSSGDDTEDFLTEDSGYLLTEDGDKFLQE